MLILNCYLCDWISALQLSELVNVEGYSDWIHLVAEFTLKSLQSWQVSFLFRETHMPWNSLWPQINFLLVFTLLTRVHLVIVFLFLFFIFYFLLGNRCFPLYFSVIVYYLSNKLNLKLQLFPACSLSNIKQVSFKSMHFDSWI